MNRTLRKPQLQPSPALLRALPWPSLEQFPQEESQGVAAAVLLPLSLQDGALSLVLTRRTDFVEHHKGEMCFPGGVREPWDADLRATALRETWEEVGIDPACVEVLGELDPVPTRTGFTIWPVVGFIPASYPFCINPREIAEVIDIPLSVLMAPPSLREEAVWRNGTLLRTWAYVYQGRVIYGATAKVLHQFVTMLAGVLGKEARWRSEIPALSR